MTAPPPDLKSRLAASYDAIAPKYNSWTTQHASTRTTWLAKLCAHLPPSPTPTASPIRILELGAGAGLPTTKLLLENYAPGGGVHVTANDISPHQLELLSQNLSGYAAEGKVTTAGGDMLSLSFAPGSLDAVVGMYSIIHLPKSEQRLLMGKIASWLKPGGWLLANFAETESEGHVMEKWLGQEGGWMYWAGWGVEATKGLVEEEAGCEVVEAEVVEDVVDAKFYWVLARRKGTSSG